MEKLKATATEECKMVIDASPKQNASKPLKRKRASNDVNLFVGDNVAQYRRELDDLFEFFKDLLGCNSNLENEMLPSSNSLFACLLEESSLPYSKLVDEIYEKLKAREGFTLAYVRSAILSVGQRNMYGIGDANADVLEDESKSCLWCWETRDLKLLHPSQRGILNVRRVGRKKVHERISALSEILSALSVPGNKEDYKSNVINASAKIRKTSSVEEIRSLVEKMSQKIDADMAEKETKQKEKALFKEMERYKRTADKKKQKMDRELQKERLQNEKELKRLQEEAEKEERRQEKLAAEEKKLLKKQKEEAERERRRHEKEEAELKRKLSLQKQATMMEKFLKTRKRDCNLDERRSKENQISGSPCKVEGLDASTSYMDNVFSQVDRLDIEELRKVHVNGWHKLSHRNRSCRWGVRRTPKTELFKELKLHGSSPITKPLEKVGTSKKGVGSEPSFDNLVDGLEETSRNTGFHTSLSLIPLLRKKLLQFDKSNRPAYYGTWKKTSDVVTSRQPFKRDPNLNYDVDSDEEWEEEEPGESLSDCDKDAEEELEEEKLKVDDEEESDDDFIVPDDYLSENEGVQVDNSPGTVECDPDAKNLSGCTPEIESEEIRALVQHRKCLETLTQQALRKGHPCVILNLMPEKSDMSPAADINNTCKLEQMCLQALCMTAFPGGSAVEISVSRNSSNEEREVPVLKSHGKSCSTPTPTAAVNISDVDLLEFVSSIQSNPQSIAKVVESLQHKFPSTPKTQLRNKIKEISDYVDNCWQVKKEISNKLGLSTSPEKGLQPKGIAAFFLRQCMTPEGKLIGVCESSQHCPKLGTHGDGKPCS